MTVKDLKELFTPINIAETDRPAESIFCCDMLSIAMGKAPAGCVWVTVMSNINTLAVATLADAAAIILAEGQQPDDTVCSKAAEQGVNLFTTPLPIYEACVKIQEKMDCGR